MAYDLEKYRVKREKVLGVRRRGLSFGIVAIIVAGVIIGGLGVIAVPQTIAYFSTRNLDDAIYKLSDSGKWDTAIVSALRDLDGITSTTIDNHETRLVVTFNRQYTGPDKIQSFLATKEVKADLLNRMDHRQRQSILKKEAAFETP